MIASSLTRPVELPTQPAAARRQLRRLLGDAGWDGDSDAVVLAVHEAMVNAQRHGGGIRRATAALDGRTVVVEVTDGGDGFNVPKSPTMPDPSGETGRGLYLIRRLADDVDVVRSGEEVCLVLRFER
jgi:anti-sigma regulatory factor (Ser/Thr protein kinase)